MQFNLNVAAWDSTITIIHFLKIFSLQSPPVSHEKKIPSWKIKNGSIRSLDTISRQMRSFHSIEHHQMTTPFVWLPPNSGRTLCLTEIDRQNTYFYSQKRRSST
jgi:hypothetical protein